MAGERTERMTRLANQATTRFARRLKLVQDLYASEATRDANFLTLDEIYEEYDKHGHFPGGSPECKSSTCVKAINLLQQALQAVSKEMGQQMQGAPQ